MSVRLRSNITGLCSDVAPQLHAWRELRRKTVVLSLVLAGLLVVSGCEQIEQARDHFRDLTPHEAYQARLNVAGLGESALARDWEAAGRVALAAPLPVSLPYAEEGYISPDAPEAAGYGFRLERGRRLTVEVSVDSGEPARVFVDLFRVPADPADPMRPVFSSESPVETFSHEPWRGGEFILRLQPELLRGGSYSVTLGLEAQLAFPVEGHGPQYIYSWFGAARDGGRRIHHGVDIFARPQPQVIDITPAPDKGLADKGFQGGQRRAPDRFADQLKPRGDLGVSSSQHLEWGACAHDHIHFG